MGRPTSTRPAASLLALLLGAALLGAWTLLVSPEPSKLAGVKAISKVEAIGIEVTAVKTASEKPPEPASSATPREPSTESAPRETESVGIVNRLDGSR